MDSIRCGEFGLYAPDLHHHSDLLQRPGRARRHQRGGLPRLLGLRRLPGHGHRRRHRPGAGHHRRHAELQEAHLHREHDAGCPGLCGALPADDLDRVPGGVRPRPRGLQREPHLLRFHAGGRHRQQPHGRRLLPRICLGLYRQLRAVRALAGDRAVCRCPRADPARGHDHRLLPQRRLVGADVPALPAQLPADALCRAPGAPRPRELPPPGPHAARHPRAEAHLPLPPGVLLLHRRRVHHHRDGDGLRQRPGPGLAGAAPGAAADADRRLSLRAAVRQVLQAV